MGTSASFALARKITACLVAALLSLALVPASALAEDGHPGAEGSEGAFGSEVPTSPQPPSDPSTEASGSSVILSEGSEAAGVEGPDTKPLTLASGLVGKPNSFINSDVILDSEPVIGSFTVDDLTYAVVDGSHVELVGVAPSVILSGGSEAAGVEESNENHASEAGLANVTLALPETITYEGTIYTLASIAPYAFYLSGVVSVTLPASVSDVDDRAFRSSDVASVTIAEGNQTYSSFDGALYSADKTRLLLIPEGRVGAVLLPRETEVADPGKFSHCSLVDAISVEDGAAFASENGLLYSSDLTTLLRVPAGATEVAIREGCTTIAAGALEACAKLTTINAPATVTSISPDAFHAIPTVSLPAASVILSEGIEDPEVEESNESHASEAGAQLTVMVALSSSDTVVFDIDPSAIAVHLPVMAAREPWQRCGFAIMASSLEATLDTSSSYAATTTVNGNGGILKLYIYGVYQPGYDAAYRSDPTWVSFWVAGNRHLVNAEPIGKYYSYCAVKSDGTENIGWSMSPDGPLLANGTKLVTGKTYYAIYKIRSYVSFNANGGHGGQSATVKATEDDPMPAISTERPQREGYIFTGWYDDPESGTQYYTANCESARNWDKETDATLYAHWTPAISADVPQAVEAKVDVLGLEEQETAEGYIMSLCGEPLKVAEVECEPLPGATQVFGANASQVRLEALVDGAAQPTLSFALGASATEGDPTKLAALTMASYGTKVPISYRFAIPDALLPQLKEASASVCRVAYTVGLA